MSAPRPANFAGHFVVAMKGKNGSLSFGTDWREGFVSKAEFLRMLADTIPSPADLGPGFYHAFFDPGPKPGTVTLNVHECSPACGARVAR